jgi:hypothetical protein
MRAQGIGAYGSIGGNGRNGGHRSSGASNIINPNCPTPSNRLPREHQRGVK